MKNNFIITIALFATFSLFSQTPMGFFLTVGGVNTSLKSNDFDSSPGTGLKYGLSWSAGYHESYNYQADFTQSSNRLTLPSVDASGNSTQIKQKNSEFEANFVVNYFIVKPEEDKLYFGLTGGIFFAYNSGTWSPVTSGENNYSFNNYSNLNYGPVLGVVAGYNKFKLGVRYNYGMANMLKDVTNGSYNEFNIYTGPTYTGKQNEITFLLYYRIFGK